MSNWTDTADALEATLEAAARILDGDIDAELPPMPELDLSSPLDAATRERVTWLLAEVESAVQAVSFRKAEINQELDQFARLRTAGKAYLSH